MLRWASGGSAAWRAANEALPVGPWSFLVPSWPPEARVPLPQVPSKAPAARPRAQSTAICHWRDRSSLWCSSDRRSPDSGGGRHTGNGNEAGPHHHSILSPARRSLADLPFEASWERIPIGPTHPPPPPSSVGGMLTAPGGFHHLPSRGGRRRGTPRRRRPPLGRSGATPAWPAAPGAGPSPLWEGGPPVVTYTYGH